MRKFVGKLEARVIYCTQCVVKILFVCLWQVAYGIYPPKKKVNRYIPCKYTNKVLQFHDFILLLF